MYQNPALFIHLTKGVTQSDVERIIDNKDFGEIESVQIQKDKSGNRNAIVRFSRWFRSADRVLNSLSRGPITIVGAEFGEWTGSIYAEPKRTLSVRKPKSNKAERRPRSPVMTDESELPEHIREFIENAKIIEPPVEQHTEAGADPTCVVEEERDQIPLAPALPEYYDPDAMEGLDYEYDLVLHNPASSYFGYEYGYGIPILKNTYEEPNYYCHASQGCYYYY